MANDFFWDLNEFAYGSDTDSQATSYDTGAAPTVMWNPASQTVSPDVIIVCSESSDESDDEPQAKQQRVDPQDPMNCDESTEQFLRDVMRDVFGDVSGS